MNTLTPRKLSLSDIADVRAYERERAEFKAHVISLKERRRLSLGTIVSVMFENRDTIRYQIQEMSRVERLSTYFQHILDTNYRIRLRPCVVQYHFRC